MEDKNHDTFSWILFLIAAILLWFAMTKTPNTQVNGLEGGNIQKAIDTKQF